MGIKIIPYLKEKLLCKTKKYLFCYYKGFIILRDSRSKNIIQKLRIHPVIKSINIIERLFRYEPRAAVAIDDCTFIYSDHGYIYRYFVKDNKVIIEHKFSKGMNNPLTFCTRYDGNGKLIDLLYGEYISNADKGSVSIYRRNNDIWNKIYSFPANTILHIHNIFFDKYRNRYIILTGDRDAESGIWQTDVNFKNVKPIVSGKQIYRACVVYPMKDGILYATDTPLEQNKLCKLYETDNGIVIDELYEMPGPCIYGAVIDNVFYMATSVEGDPSQNVFKYRFLNKLGKGVRDKFVHIIKYSPDGTVGEIASFKKDILPMWLFQFGNAKFPVQIDKDRVYLCPQSAKAKMGTYIIY